MVVHYARSAAAAASLVVELEALGVGAHSIQADLAVPEEAERLVARARERAGGLDALVNNASIFEAETLDAAALERLVRNVKVNVWAPFVLTRALARESGRGKVVNLLDARLAGLDLAHAGYFLSKHLLAVITRMSAVAFGPDDVARAVVFLLESEFITGQVVFVDGGQHLREAVP